MTLQEKNKQLVLEAFDAALNGGESDAFERYWSPIEKEVTKDESKSGLPMFKNYFANS